MKLVVTFPNTFELRGNWDRPWHQLASLGCFLGAPPLRHPHHSLLVYRWVSLIWLTGALYISRHAAVPPLVPLLKTSLPTNPKLILPFAQSAHKHIITPHLPTHGLSVKWFIQRYSHRESSKDHISEFILFATSVPAQISSCRPWHQHQSWWFLPAVLQNTEYQQLSPCSILCQHARFCMSVRDNLAIS